MARAKAKAFDGSIWKYWTGNAGGREREIFRIAKAQDKATQDYKHVKQIKDERGE